MRAARAIGRARARTRARVKIRVCAPEGSRSVKAAAQASLPQARRSSKLVGSHSSPRRIVLTIAWPAKHLFNLPSRWPPFKSCVCACARCVCVECVCVCWPLFGPRCRRSCAHAWRLRLTLSGSVLVWLERFRHGSRSHSTRTNRAHRNNHEHKSLARTPGLWRPGRRGGRLQCFGGAALGGRLAAARWAAVFAAAAWSGERVRGLPNNLQAAAACPARRPLLAKEQHQSVVLTRN